MSGFCGWIGGRQTGDDGEAVLRRMSSALQDPSTNLEQRHRASGGGIALVSNAAVSDWYRDENMVAVVEGYPRWTPEDLQEQAPGPGNAAVLARAYRRHGTELFSSLKGPFSFALWDLEKQRLLLAIDRFGVHTINFARAPDGAFVFGSRADNVSAYPGMGATILPQTIYNYFHFIDRVPAPDSIYEEQSKLLPGQYLVLDGDRQVSQHYWRMPYQVPGRTDEAALCEELMAHLRTAVERCARGGEGERTGTFLSGGLDSSTVTGLMTQANGGNVEAFSIGFGVEGFDEIPYARAAANHFDCSHDVYYATPADIRDLIVPISEYYDEPFANSSAIPSFLCARQAKQAGVEVMLAGDGGDELFAGNSRYLTDRIFQHYTKIPAALRKAVLEPIVQNLPLRDRIAFFRRSANYVRKAKQSIAGRLVDDNVYEYAAASTIFSPEAMAAISKSQPTRIAEELFSDGAAETPLQKMFQLDLRLTLADGDLRKVSRTCEMAGVQVRYPYLDEDLVEFSAGIASSTLLRDGRLRALFKNAMNDFLPASIINKPKQGFGIPIFHFIDNDAPLTVMFCDFLSSAKRHGIFRGDFIDELISNVRNGQSDCYSGIVWDLTVLEIWLASRKLDVS